MPSASPSAGSLFPLRLEPFDRMMQDDDCRRYPMSFPLAIELSGSLQADKFEQAIRAAIARHPLYEARLSADRRGRPVFAVDGAVERTRIVFRPMDAPPPRQSFARLDLRRGQGLRVLVETSPARTRATFVMHHASADGMGGYRFIGDALALYGASVGAAEPTAAVPIDPGLLRTRGDSYGAALGSSRASFDILESLKSAGLEVIERDACQLYAPRKASFRRALQPYPNIVKRSLEPDAFHALRKAAEKQGVFPNDLLAVATLRTIAAWNARRARPSSKSLRLCVPVDLRRKGDEMMPSANVVSMSFLQRSTAECESPEGLLDYVREETRRQKTINPAAHFANMLGLAYGMPGVVATTLRGTRCMSTAVLSNIGDPTRRFTAILPRVEGKLVAGDVVLEEIYGISPIRHGTRVAFGAQSYNRRLLLTMRCDPWRYTVADSDELMDRFVDQALELSSRWR